MTLIEVIAGLALLAAVLSGILTVRSRATLQWNYATQRLEAVAAADALLSEWWQDIGRFPRSDAGAVPGEAGLYWRTWRVTKPEIELLGGQVVRLQVGRATDPAADPAGVTVEVILPAQGGQ